VQYLSLTLIRIAVASNMLIHGIYRLSVGGVTPFDEYLSGMGFPAFTAWAITAFEIIAAILILFGKWVGRLSIVFIIELSMGVILLHRHEGWFVVGGGRNGMEYSVLMIICFVALTIVALSNRAGRRKLVYLRGSEVKLNGDQRCQNFIATMRTSSDVLEASPGGLELLFEDEKLIKAFQWISGVRSEHKLSKEEIGFKYPDYPENKHYALFESEDGLHRLGGEVPSAFRIPKIKVPVPFQYLGSISNKDQIFDWLPFPVHLTCPIYVSFDKLYLDYSDPNKPIVFNEQEMETQSFHEDILNTGTEIVFYEKKVSFSESSSFSQSCAGIPHYAQYPEIPICPKSGKRMRFLCELNQRVPVKRSNIDLAKTPYPSNYEAMDFSGAGCLFVFFEPRSKMACYFIQST